MMPMNGPTKFFFEDPAVDRLLAMVMSLGAELAALRDDVETLKALAVEKGLMTHDDLATHVASASEQAARDRAREALVANLLFPLEQACEALKGDAA